MSSQSGKFSTVYTVPQAARKLGMTEHDALRAMAGAGLKPLGDSEADRLVFPAAAVDALAAERKARADAARKAQRPARLRPPERTADLADILDPHRPPPAEPGIHDSDNPSNSSMFDRLTPENPHDLDGGSGSGGKP
jgi:hypothetical protein